MKRECSWKKFPISLAFNLVLSVVYTGQTATPMGTQGKSLCILVG
jgi:hypothetical protein